MSMGGRAEGPEGARTPIGASGNFNFKMSNIKLMVSHVMNQIDVSLLGWCNLVIRDNFSNIDVYLMIKHIKIGECFFS